jgi:sec-independent protein translocase protein TatC
MFFKRKNNKTVDEAQMSFLDHLEALRSHLIRATIAILIAAVTLFCYREFIFDALLFAPKHSDFITYRLLCKLSHFLQMGDALCISNFGFELINTTLSGQFTMHMWVAFVGGLVVAFPYIAWELWRFIKPALSTKELTYSKGIVFFTTLLFVIGILFGYYVISPLSINFLGTYAVSNDVKNMIEMDSYISTITTITLASGLVFELPIVIYFLTKIGLITPVFMRKYRKHAIVVILLLAAVITPSPDVTSQMLVAIPIYILYEGSIFVSAYVMKKKEE